MKENLFFECIFCKKPIKVNSKTIKDEKAIKRFAEKHFLEEHNLVIENHNLVKPN